MNIRVLALALTVSMLAGCSGGESALPSNGPPASETAAEPTASAPQVTVRNAYLSSELDEQGAPGTPQAEFKTGDKAYVGVVLLGDAPKNTVSVEWSVDGAAVGEASTVVATQGSAIATIDITADEPLNPGHYQAVVSVDGNPSWELDFDVR